MTPLISTFANASARGFGGLRTFGGGDTAFDSIATTSVGAGGASSVTFSSIPSTYKHLQLRMLANSTKSGSSGADTIELTLNNDATANYSAHRLAGDGSSASSAGYSGLNQIYFGVQPQTISGVSYYGVYVIDLLDYANTSKYKTIRSLGGYDSNGAGTIALYSGSWRSTSAVNSIEIYSDNRTALFSQYSHFALYGVK